MRDNVTIAMIAPVQPEDFFDLLWQGIWEATFDLSSFGVEVQDLTSNDNDVGEQRRILASLLDSHPDAIGLMPAHISALNDLIDQHAMRGTPVITFHSDAPGSRRTAFVRPDLRQAGALAGEVLAKLMHGHGRVLSFPGLLDQFHVAQRYHGFREALARYDGRIEETACPSVTPQLLQAAGPVDGYYVGNDLVKIAAMIEQFGGGIPCVGFSNTELVRPFLERGVVSAVIDEKRYQLGYFAVQKAYEAVLKTEARAPLANVQIPSQVVFSANAAGAGDSLDNAFELLIRQRTETLLSYKNSLEQANVKLLDLATTDPLTGLYNRRKFDETLMHEVSRALRYAPVSLLAIDLNFFKAVNDRHGHQTGDDALKAVAQVLRSSCRATDTCARLGGDEFAIILPHSDPTAAQIVLQRVHTNIARLVIPTASGGLTIGLSIGCATVPQDADSVANLMAAADPPQCTTRKKPR